MNKKRKEKSNWIKSVGAQSMAQCEHSTNTVSMISYTIVDNCRNEAWIWCCYLMRLPFGAQLQLFAFIADQTIQQTRVFDVHFLGTLNTGKLLLSLVLVHSKRQSTYHLAGKFGISFHLTINELHRFLLIVVQCVQHTRLYTVAHAFGRTMLTEECFAIVFTFRLAKWHEQQFDVIFEFAVFGRQLRLNESQTIRA